MISYLNTVLIVSFLVMPTLGNEGSAFKDETVHRVVQKLKYARDDRTGLCFAVGNHLGRVVMTNVSCEAVNDQLEK